VIDQTSEGLRIQIADQEKVAMFPLGGSQMYPQARELLAKIVLAIGNLPHKISVVGHTDSAPFASGRTYGNWELSADRANASRRALVELGLPASRIARVGGLAETDPLVPEDPLSARNRRICITLLRQIPRQAATVPANGYVPSRTDSPPPGETRREAAVQAAPGRPGVAVP
jgi:chemotaxis protein MotB